MRFFFFEKLHFWEDLSCPPSSPQTLSSFRSWPFPWSDYPINPIWPQVPPLSSVLLANSFAQYFGFCEMSSLPPLPTSAPLMSLCIPWNIWNKNVFRFCVSTARHTQCTFLHTSNVCKILELAKMGAIQMAFMEFNEYIDECFWVFFLHFYIFFLPADAARTRPESRAAALRTLSAFSFHRTCNCMRVGWEVWGGSGCPRDPDGSLFGRCQILHWVLSKKAC